MVAPCDVSGQLESDTHLLEENGDWESCASAGHGCLLSNRGWGKWERERWWAFVGELGRRGCRSVVTFGTRWTQPVAWWPVFSFVAQRETAALSTLSYPAAAVPNTNHSSVTLFLLHSWRTLSLWTCPGAMVHTEGDPSSTVSDRSLWGVSVPRLWSRGQEGSLCEQTGLEAVMTASFEDYPLVKAADRVCEWAGIWFLLDRVRGDKALEIRVVVTPQNSVYVQVWWLLLVHTQQEGIWLAKVLNLWTCSWEEMILIYPVKAYNVEESCVSTCHEL